MFGLFDSDWAAHFVGMWRMMMCCLRFDEVAENAITGSPITVGRMQYKYYY